MSEQESAGISNVDRDSLHILPLSILPVETKALKRARLIKNARLESVVEFFDDLHSGSGQVEIEALGGQFDWPQTPSHPDLILMRKLGELPSYDVYSLRIALRQHGIDVNNVESLKLSEAKAQELKDYMTSFTHPLIMEVYGDSDVEIQNFADIVALFREPDIKKAREKLEVMAGKLDIKLEEVPRFLEDYGDIFLSFSYYRQCLDQVGPVIEEFLKSLKEIRENWQLKSDANLMKTCERMDSIFNTLLATITSRFETFDRSTKNMWDNITAERFRQVEELIGSYHTTIGGELCSLGVKMNAWHRLFPTPDSGGPVKRSEFIMSDMKQGIEKIRLIERSAPVLQNPD
ncbi:MAG: hypothetical protein QF511_12770 [Rhodospirillales bacterium]|nr:hypothetical protein [Rhodospirillales bacterium]HIJ43399.1 hypothetical protein [Rhodospirillaceae bacterium]MDP7099354.1 hypothetical protein [Rhodospirillales bacterium]MDP7214859.1 hypothetical protein [Rhodospirillales bacterium]HIJ45223.1 hypothetical protein [Rhodospirillaceae bacterium]